MAVAPSPVHIGPPQRHRFTVAQYHRMIETSVLGKEDRVELLNGEIVDMWPIGKKHQGTVKRLLALFRVLGQREVVIGVQDPLLLDDRSEPQPDLVLLKYRPDYYTKSLAGPGDVLLLIEVADSSLGADRRFKVPIYAKAGIAEVWIVDVNTLTVEVLREPMGDRYGQTQVHKRTGGISPVSFPGLVIGLEELFASLV